MFACTRTHHVFPAGWSEPTAESHGMGVGVGVGMDTLHLQTNRHLREAGDRNVFVQGQEVCWISK